MNQIRALLSSYRVTAPPNQLYRKKALQKLRETSLPSKDLILCLQTSVSSLEALQTSIDELSKRIGARTQEEKATAVLTELPNIGPLTATTLIVALGDVRRFRNAKAVASYAGLAPRVSNSADKSHHGRITKRGNRELRWILSQWAVRLLSFDSIAKQWAKPLLLRMHRNKGPDGSGEAPAHRRLRHADQGRRLLPRALPRPLAQPTQSDSNGDVLREYSGLLRQALAAERRRHRLTLLGHIVSPKRRTDRSDTLHTPDSSVRTHAHC